MKPYRPGPNSGYVLGRFINRVNCDHAECAELRRIRAEAFTAGLMGVVNGAERALAKCAVQEDKK